MPSGGGSAGGGGGGGGGGFHSSSSRSSNEKIDCPTAIFLSILILLFVAGSIFAVVFGRRDSSSNIATNFYSPGDSRLISFSSFFCDGINLGVNSVNTSATIYVVDTPPSITEVNNFTIVDRRTLNISNYRFWQYYLYPKSVILISVCSDKRLDLYIIKGNSNANNWGGSPGDNHAEEFEQIISVCPHQLQNISYTVHEEDQYYVLLHNSMSESRLTYDAALSFERFEYDPLGINGSSCSASSGQQCTVGVPYGTSSQQALVVTNIPENVDWGENVDVKATCSRRDWAYALVVLIPLSVVSILITLLIILCLCYSHSVAKYS